MPTDPFFIESSDIMNEFELTDGDTVPAASVTDTGKSIFVRPRGNINVILSGAAIGLGVYLLFRIPYAVYQVTYLNLQTSFSSLAAFLGPEPWLGRVLSSVVNLFSLMAFFISMLMLRNRRADIGTQNAAFSLDLLDADDDAILLPDDALRLRNRIRQLSPAQQSLTLIRCLWSGLQRARANWSADDAANAVKNQVEIASAEAESEYAILKYLVWAIPSIGFIGTVMGISSALYAFGEGYSESESPVVINTEASGGNTASEPLPPSGEAKERVADPERQVEDRNFSDVESLRKKTAQEDAIRQATGHLHQAFDTTLVALILSIIAMYFLHAVQASDDAFLVKTMDWCMQRFVLRMHTPKGDH